MLSLLGAPAAQAGFLIDSGDEPATGETVQMSHLPTWVQVATAGAVLYASDTGNQAATADRLPRFSFLRVLGGATERLQVEVTGETGEAGPRGWIDPNVVLPSAAGRDWLVTSSATSLWRGADAGALEAGTLDRFTPLQQLDGPVQGRLEVRVYRSDLLAVVDQGWVDLTDTGPAFAPSSRVPDPTRTVDMRKLSGSDQAQQFLNSAAQAAMTASARTGVPASVTVAQAILESDWGRSALSQSASNYFGIKATGGLGNDGVVWMPTAEYDANGLAYETTSAFRAYRSLADSVIDHDLMLGHSQRYAPAMQAARDPRQFAQLLAEAGYATDPSYADKLIALMDRYDLYRLDA
jgi:hypothetical protein